MWASRYPCPLQPDKADHFFLETPGARITILDVASRMESALAKGYGDKVLKLVRHSYES